MECERKSDTSKYIYLNISNVIRINIMHVIVPLWIMTCSNTLVYSGECVCLFWFSFCFTLLSCECIFLCVLCCLMLIDVFHIQMHLTQRVAQWNEYVCMYVMYVCTYVCMYVCTYIRNNMGNLNHLKIIQAIPEQHNGHGQNHGTTKNSHILQKVLI